MDLARFNIHSKLFHLVMSAVLNFRYHYGCVIYGWDPVCRMDETWIQQMGVDQSPGGRNQPFYNVLGDDGSQRYAAHSKHSIEINVQTGFTGSCCTSCWIHG